MPCVSWWALLDSNQRLTDYESGLPLFSLVFGNPLGGEPLHQYSCPDKDL